MSRFYTMLQHKWFPPLDPTTSFKGKNVIVTGANTGLGFEAAVKFVALEASLVVLGVRSIEMGEHAKAMIEKRTGEKGRIEVWQLDMNSYDSIQEFGKRASRLDHLDVVVLNAGVFMVKYEESNYGWEETLQVNTVSTALLALLLFPKLKASKFDTESPVLEFVSSGNHRRIDITEEHRKAENLLQSYSTPEGYRANQQYAASKLFVMYVMQTLASLAKPYADAAPDVLVTSVCPSFCASKLSRGYSGIIANIFRFIFFTLFLRTTEQGARTLVSGTTLGPEAHGEFWQHDQLQPLAPLVSDEEGAGLRHRVWFEILSSLRKDVPGVVDSISKH